MVVVIPAVVVVVVGVGQGGVGKRGRVEGGVRVGRWLAVCRVVNQELQF